MVEKKRKREKKDKSGYTVADLVKKFNKDNSPKIKK